MIEEGFNVYIPSRKVFEVAVAMERLKRGEIEKWWTLLEDGWRLDIGNYVNVGGVKERLKTAYAIRVANYSFGDRVVMRLWYGEWELLIRRMLEFLRNVDISARADGLVLLKTGDRFTVSYGIKTVELDVEERFKLSQSIRNRWYYKGNGFFVSDKGVSFAGYMVSDVVPLYLFLEVGLWRDMSSLLL